MAVTSGAWLLAMALITAVYWSLPREISPLVLALATAAFLAFFAPASFLLLFAFALVAYLALEEEKLVGWRAATACLLFALVLLIYRAAPRLATEAAFVMPLGLAYFSLRCVHYVVERYRGTLPPHDFKDLLSYLFFLPTIIAGPIHRFREFHRDAGRLRWNPAYFSEGLERILYGYVKVNFLANFLVSAKLAGLAESLSASEPVLSSYLSMLQWGLNGYLQFSGYSDIAIGFALLLGYRVMENFRWPLLRRNIQEFWESWHISLSSWCRDYVYMAGVSLTRKPAFGVLLSMLVLGLWHELSLRYLLWGLYNALGIVAWQQFQKLKPRFGLGGGEARGWQVAATQGLAIALNFHFVMLGFVLVHFPQPAESLNFYLRLFALGGAD